MYKIGKTISSTSMSHNMKMLFTQLFIRNNNMTILTTAKSISQHHEFYITNYILLLAQLRKFAGLLLVIGCFYLSITYT